MAWSASDLEAVEAAIRSLLSGGAVQEYSIRGRNTKYMTLAELRALRDEIKVEISLEDDESPSGLPMVIGVPSRHGSFSRRGDL